MADCDPLELEPAHTNADWRPEPIQFFAGSKANPEDFTGASFVFAMRLAGTNDAPTLFTTAAGTLVLTLPDEIAPAVPRSVMRTIPPGDYEWDLVCTRAGGEVDWMLGGTLPVIGGVAP